MKFIMTEPYIFRCKYFVKHRSLGVYARCHCSCKYPCFDTEIGCKFNLRSFNDVGDILIIRIKNKDRKWAVQNLQSEDKLRRIVAGVIVDEI